MTADSTESRTPERAGNRSWAASARRAGHVLGVLVLVVLVAPFVVFAVPQVVGADASYVVLSGSMEPAISPGDVVVVDAVQPRSVAAGDVITFEQGAGVPPTTHRVVEVTEVDGAPAFVTKGDNNEDPDSVAVPASALVGRVTLVIPLVGHVVLFADTQYGWLVLVGVPLSLLVLNEGWRLVAARRVADETAPDPDDVHDEHERVEAATSVVEPSGYQVSVADLSLTTLALVVLVAYSGSTFYRELGAQSVRIETTMVLAGGVMALLLVAAGRLSAALAARRAAGDDDADDGPGPETDVETVAADGGQSGGDN